MTAAETIMMHRTNETCKALRLAVNRIEYASRTTHTHKALEQEIQAVLSKLAIVEKNIQL